MGFFTDLLGEAIIRSQERRYEREAKREQEKRDREWDKFMQEHERAQERRRREIERLEERAAREREMRLSTLRSDIESAARELSNYKRSSVNPQLTSSALQQQPAMRVSEYSMNNDVQSRINNQIARDESNETSSLKTEIEMIDSLLAEISELERAS